MHISQQCIRSNMLPTWRAIALGHMRQLRMMIADGRQTVDARQCLKRAQRSALNSRKQWQAAA